MGSQRYIIPKEIETDKSLGGKTIGYPGSLVYTINNISGPGMLAIPLCLQQGKTSKTAFYRLTLAAGWLFPLLCLLMIWIVSSLASTMMCEAMILIPNNHRLGQRYVIIILKETKLSFVFSVEYATLIKHFFGSKAYWISQVLYNISLVVSNNTQSIEIQFELVDVKYRFNIGYCTSYGCFDCFCMRKIVCYRIVTITRLPQLDINHRNSFLW